MPDPVNPEHLHWLPTGRVWRAAPDANLLGDTVPRDPVYFTKHMVKRAERRLRRENLLHEAGTPERAQVVRQAVEGTLNRVRAITKAGALTRLAPGTHDGNDKSTDYLFHGPDETRTWQGDVVSMIVRQLPVAPAGIPQRDAPTIDGLINVAITLVVLTKTWLKILRGEPVPENFATHLIAVGRCFDLDEHCAWFKRPPSPEVFGSYPRTAT